MLPQMSLFFFSGGECIYILGPACPASELGGSRRRAARHEPPSFDLTLALLFDHLPGPVLDKARTARLLRSDAAHSMYHSSPPSLQHPSPLVREEGTVVYSSALAQKFYG